MPDFDIQQFGSGVHNLLDREDIPKDAASDSTNWITMGFVKIIDLDISTQQDLDYLTNDKDIVFLGAN